MHNMVYLIGKVQFFKQTEDNKVCIIIKLSNRDGDFSTPIYTSFDSNNSFIDLIEEDALIGIKGFLSLDENNNLIVIADKLTFLSSKNNEGDE